MSPITTPIRHRLLTTLDAPMRARQVARARYMREVYRKARKSLNVTLEAAVFDEVIAPRAAAAGLAPTAYLREAALAYTTQRFLVPAGLEAALFAVTDQLAALGNNLNQIARYANRHRAASRQDLADARALVERATALVEAAVRLPARVR